MDILLWEQLPEDAKEAGTQGLKSEDEIARFTVDEHLSLVERTNLFLAGGHLVQQRKAVDSLPALLKASGRAGWEAVQTNLQVTLQNLDADAQLATAEALAAAVQQHALPDTDVADCLLPLAMANNRSKDTSEEEAEAWLQLLLDMLPALPARQLLDEVVPLALSKGQVNEPVLQRVSCCRLLGAMAPLLAPADVSSRCASHLLAACQDTDYVVRIAAAQQLPALSRALGPAAVVSQVLPELTELLEDDEGQVRVCGLSGLVVLVDLLPSYLRKAKLLPLVRRHMQPLELALPLQRALAAAFPQLLAAIQDDLEPSDAGLLYGCFRHLAARADAELRRTCALGLPALMGAPLPGSSACYLHDTWTDLAADHDPLVRAAIASSFHLAACSVAPTDACRLLRRPLVTLLRDSCPEVRHALLPGLGETLQVLAGVDDMHKEGVAADVHQALLALSAGLGNNWRSQQQLAEALHALPGLLGVDIIADHWAPYAFTLLLSGAAAVKPAAAACLGKLLRNCRKERPRTDLYCRIIRELAWGRSCFARLAYIQVCAAALPIFSSRWVKEHVLEGVLEMLSDEVPNVRLAALGLLPALKQTIRLPEDVEQLEQLTSAMTILMTDNDRDVSYAARSVHDTFKRTPLRVTGGSGLMELSGSMTGGSDVAAADKAKEEAEQTEMEFAKDEMEKLRIEWCSTGPERRSRRAAAGMTTGDGSSSNNNSGSGGSSSSSSSHGPMRKSNSRGKMDSHIGGGPGSSTSSSRVPSDTSSSNGCVGGSSKGAGIAMNAAGSGNSSASTGFRVAATAVSAGSNWSSADRRFGSGAASTSSSTMNNSTFTSSSSTATGGPSYMRGLGPSSASTARPGLDRRLAAGVAGTASTVPSSSTATSSGQHTANFSSNSTGSPRHAPSSGMFGSGAPGSTRIAVGTGIGSGLGSSTTQLLSPTGSSANLRLPVLAGSPKAAAGGSGCVRCSDSNSSPLGCSSSNSSSSSSLLGGLSRYGGGVTALAASTGAATLGITNTAAGARAGAAGLFRSGGSGDGSNKPSSSSTSSSNRTGVGAAGSLGKTAGGFASGSITSSGPSSNSSSVKGYPAANSSNSSRLFGPQGTPAGTYLAKRFK